MVNRQVFMLWGATGYMFEQEQIEVAAGASDSPRARAHRWTSYLVARLSVAADSVDPSRAIVLSTTRLCGGKEGRPLGLKHVALRIADALSLVEGL